MSPAICNGCQAPRCYVEEVCNRCSGYGWYPHIAVGLGQMGMMPAYCKKTCPNCGGTGRLRFYCDYY